MNKKKWLNSKIFFTFTLVFVVCCFMATRDDFAAVGIPLTCLPPRPPVADFKGTPTTGAQPLTVYFTDFSTDATSWSWDFGDGGTSTARNPSHTYTLPGTYTVRLIATSPFGSDVETKVGYITVLPPPPPSADFTASSTEVFVGESVAFTDLSTNSPIRWSWTFEGGTPSTSTEQNPTVTYYSVGTFDVTLTATNMAGSDTKTKYNYITVNYCRSSAVSQRYEYIADVTVGDLHNSSGASPYSDFTDLGGGRVTRGDRVSVSLTPGFPRGSYTESWRIWIDYNQDGYFDDIGEEVFRSSSSSPVMGSFTIPASANTGKTRMRISMRYGGYPAPCGSFPYGEVEDYTVKIM